jgi:hypothetical protein
MPSTRPARIRQRVHGSTPEPRRCRTSNAAPLTARAPAFRQKLLQRIQDRGIRVVDLNVDPRLVDLEWVFIDRYHLTDEAQRAVAEILAEAIRT